MPDVDDQSIGRLLLYQTEDGRAKIQVRLQDETLWMTRSAIAELFQITPQAITLHLRRIFNDRELLAERVSKYYFATAADGKRYKTGFYSLEAVLAVGYRVRSHRGTQFRQWATERLRDYLVKGFAMDDERLKEGRSIGADYFDELIERIRDIRASEKRFYQKLRDIYALSIDYDASADTTKRFFQHAQNKLHWAITGMTAAEVIKARADARQPNMGLTSWKGAKVRRDDVVVAKNYLTGPEIEQFNRIVVMYLDYAEDQANRGRALYMADWEAKLNAFLQFNERDVLGHLGAVRMEVAKALALNEYDVFNGNRLREEAERANRDDAFAALEDEWG
jgi:hypothetical protein